VLDVAPTLGLHVRRRCDVIPRAETKGALFTVWTLTAAPEEAYEEATFVARDTIGRRTEEHRALRGFFGLESDGS
jgi:hypothetical protein